MFLLPFSFSLICPVISQGDREPIVTSMNLDTNILERDGKVCKNHPTSYLKAAEHSREREPLTLFPLLKTD